MKLGELLEHRVITISNLLTLLRIVTVPLVAWFLYQESVTDNQIYRYYQLVGMVVIILSDFLDGYLARLLDQESPLGQFLDPMADKITAIVLGSFLVIYKGFPLWLLLFALGREVLVVLLAFVLFSHRDVEVRPNIFGKICVAIMAIAAVLYTMEVESGIAGVSFKAISVFLILFFYILGGVVYIQTYSGHYRDTA